MSYKIGGQTYALPKPVYMLFPFTIVGPQEGKGNYGEYYDLVLENDEWGCKSHEKTEVKMRKAVIDGLLEKGGLNEHEIDCIMGGDLLNQITPTTFSVREFETPFVGLYTACSTYGLALAMASIAISGGFMDNVICSTSSHYGTAERQYRFPLELGTQSCPSSQWTVTGAGGTLLSGQSKKRCPTITHVTIGKIVDLGIVDANNMGAAMAPSACDTILQHLKDTNRQADYYDLILTGDLGKFGRDLVHYLCKIQGVDIAQNLNDCGAMVYKDTQKCTQGGSGAGCCTVVFNSYIYEEMLKGNINKVLLVPTGALLSKTSTLQGESIPCVSHAISIEIEEFNNGNIPNVS